MHDLPVSSAVSVPTLLRLSPSLPSVSTCSMSLPPAEVSDCRLLLRLAGVAALVLGWLANEGAKDRLTMVGGGLGRGSVGAGLRAGIFGRHLFDTEEVLRPRLLRTVCSATAIVQRAQVS